MTQASEERAILFADICGSSGLYKALGNHAAEHKIRTLLAQVKNQVDRHQGQVIKTIGDEVMACFADANRALACAQAIQQQLHHSAGALQLRIGASFGPVVCNDNDLFGESVNDAAFVARIARAQEIIVTPALVSALAPAQAKHCREFDQVALKGGAQKQIIYRAQWQKEASASATQVMSLVQTQQIKQPVLCLTLGGQTLQITPEQTPYTLGRAEYSNVRINSQFASREHCHILYRRGKYVLIDHSTNGTYVLPRQQREIYLRREETPLEGDGQFSLGQPVAANAFPIHYSYQQS